MTALPNHIDSVVGWSPSRGRSYFRHHSNDAILSSLDGVAFDMSSGLPDDLLPAVVVAGDEAGNVAGISWLGDRGYSGEFADPLNLKLKAIA